MIFGGIFCEWESYIFRNPSSLWQSCAFDTCGIVSKFSSYLREEKLFLLQIENRIKHIMLFADYTKKGLSFDPLTFMNVACYTEK